MENNKIATFGAGCFWCVEAIFQQLEGVVDVYPGYAGGNVKNPSYKEVCTGKTNHAEVAQIVYNPSVISYNTLLDVFWNTHDPTTLNRQGNDIGSQYRSVVFYHSNEQKEKAEKFKKKLDDNKTFKNKIVTKIVEINNFYKAEDYHEDYYIKNKDKNPYCKIVIAPKIKKFIKKYKNQLKK